MKILALLSFVALGIASLHQAASASVADEHGWQPIFTSISRPVDAQTMGLAQAMGRTIPTFTTSVTSPADGYSFPATIVGTNPTRAAATSEIQYVPISIRWHFYPGNVVLDPTKPGCGDSVSVNDRFFHSPLFVNTPQTSNGVNVGNTQAIDAFQRAEFWQYVHNKNYHVLLRTKDTAPIVVDEVAPIGSVLYPRTDACTKLSQSLLAIDINAYDALLQAVTKKYTLPNQLPIILSYNVTETSGGGCCVLGYHSTVDRGNVQQPYATGAYTDHGVFRPGIEDIHAWSHELGELFNDPYVTNITPAWGHIGQEAGCQGNLETGDPLTGTAYLDKLNGFTYHPQEQAFFSWFYRTRSTGTAGFYSFEGTFRTAQPVCD